jgi:hypothetical protein
MVVGCYVEINPRLSENSLTSNLPDNIVEPGGNLSFEVAIFMQQCYYIPGRLLLCLLILRGYGFELPDGDYFSMAVGVNNQTQIAWGEAPSYAGPGNQWVSQSIDD